MAPTMSGVVLLPGRAPALRSAEPWEEPAEVCAPGYMSIPEPGDTGTLPSGYLQGHSHPPLPAGPGRQTPSFLPSLSLKRAQGLLQPPPDTLQPQPCPVANTFSHPGFPEAPVSWGAPPVGSQHDWFF